MENKVTTDFLLTMVLPSCSSKVSKMKQENKKKARMKRNRKEKKNQLLSMYIKIHIAASIDKDIYFTCFAYGDYGRISHGYSGLTQEEEMNPFYESLESFTFLDTSFSFTSKEQQSSCERRTGKKHLLVCFNTKLFCLMLF